MRATRGSVSAGRYGVAGGLIGFLFPCLAWLLDAWQHSAPRTLAALWQLHLHNPLHWIINTAPVVLGLLGFLYGKSRQGHAITHHAHQFLEAVLQTVDCLVVVVDLHGTIVRFNRQCEQVTGYRADEVLGRTFNDLFLLPADLPQVDAVVQQLLRGQRLVRHENSWRTKNGALRMIAWSNTVLHNQHGEIVYLVGTGVDVTEQRQLERERFALLEQLREQAMVDPLTGIANRRYFLDATTALLQRSGGDGSMSVLLFDVDHFKAVNDRCGHQAGDEVLQRIVERCRQHVRATDLLARYGGEEFVVALPNTTGATAHQIAERLRASIADTPIATACGPISVTISGGVVERTGAHHDLAALIADADHALYTAKQAGRNKIMSAVPFPS